MELGDEGSEAMTQLVLEQPLEHCGIDRLVELEVGVHGPAHPAELRGENRGPLARFLPVAGGKRHDYMDILAFVKTDTSAEIVAAIAARAEGDFGH